jgi:hypothetical protein
VKKPRRTLISKSDDKRHIYSVGYFRLAIQVTKDGVLSRDEMYTAFSTSFHPFHQGLNIKREPAVPVTEWANVAAPISLT